jgi:hypothetical protein
MQTIEIPWKKHGDKFEELIKEEKIFFPWANPDSKIIELEWVKMNLGILDLHKIKWQIGHIGLTVPKSRRPPNIVVKILNDPLIGYLDIYNYNETFMWCNHDHSKSEHPDVVSRFSRNQ